MIGILWFWKEWKSTYNWLLKQWVKPSEIKIFDKKHQKNYLEWIQDCEIIYKSPWISIYDPAIKAVKHKITSQAQVFFERYNWKIILVSGSKWKSTTSTLMYLFLKNAWKNVKLVWNIWNPIFDEIDFNNPPEYVVFEISSYMLDSTPNVKCDYSILTNLYKVHTSWHKTHENYKKSKFKLLKAKKIASVNVQLKPQIKEKENIKWFGPSTNYFYSDDYLFWEKIKIEKSKIKLGWEHNYLNIVSCFPILEAENIEEKVIEKVLWEFNWLPHRQEFVRKVNSVEYYNDSIATIPESVIQVLERFKNNLDTIILWWQESGFDYSQLIEKINNHKLKNVILLPDSFDNLIDAFKNKKVFKVKTLEEAVKIASQVTEKNKVCVLSPWAPSLNMFKNFEERGNIFKQLVNNL